jgi:thiamine pyrophosphokinase
MHEHIVVISGSSPLAPHVVDAITDEAILLAVDGGLDQALAAGLTPSGLIGDLDSVTAEGLAWAEEYATIARHPTDKNDTDTELALAFAADMNPARLTLIGGGDRLDHGLAAVGALGHHVLTSIPRLDGWWDGQHIDVVHGPGQLDLDLAPGSTLSLLALHGPCTGVTITGVRWPLVDADIAPLVGLGVSNEVDPAEGDGGPVVVRLSTGVLTIFDAPHVDPIDPLVPQSAKPSAPAIPPARNPS